MTPETRACLRAMACVRRWLQKELDNDEAGPIPRMYEQHRTATMRACIQALHPCRNPRLKVALNPLTKRKSLARAIPKKKGGEATEKNRQSRM